VGSALNAIECYEVLQNACEQSHPNSFVLLLHCIVDAVISDVFQASMAAVSDKISGDKPRQSGAEI
jgi:hypothetical protein